jgi:alpha-tubulin suppressor-like RCC1 family protein
VADSATPSTRFTASNVSVGSAQTCAVTADKRIACWSRSMPQAHVFSALTSVSGLSMGVNYGCAIAAGAAQCWGKDGRVLNQPAGSETPVISLAGATAVSAGETFTCAMTSTGARCWGTFTMGDPEVVKQVDVGYSMVCGVTAKGGLDCWDSDHPNIPPTQVLISDVAQVSCGAMHCCLVTTADEAACWGFNTSGQIGQKPVIPPSTLTRPAIVPGLPSVSRVSAGAEHSCALTPTAEVWCWGLGYGFKPVKVELGQGATEVDAGEGYSCAVLADQSVKCWASGGAATTIGL